MVYFRGRKVQKMEKNACKVVAVFFKLPTFAFRKREQRFQTESAERCLASGT